MMTANRLLVAGVVFVAMVLGSALTWGADEWISFPGGDGAGKGKKVVLVSGDEEYRSEEALPQLAKILSKHHGFACTVLFAIDPKDGTINPNVTTNIPGLEALDSADLLIIQTRFRDLPDDQMKHVVDFLAAGKPVIGMRTATHAFNIPKGKTYAKFSYNFGGKDFEKGFGRQVLGETWVNHHGSHGKQSTAGIIAPGAENHPILKGIKNGDIWGPTDVYVAKPTEGSTILVLGAVLSGMKPTDAPIEGPKNNPMMPVAWAKNYKVGDGKEGRSFCTTMGAATDLPSEGVRRMLVNAAYWGLGMEDKIDPKMDVSIVGKYTPTAFGFGGYKKGMKPQDYASEQ
jgi:hypothetical protein